VTIYEQDYCITNKKAHLSADENQQAIGLYTTTSGSTTFEWLMHPRPIFDYAGYVGVEVAKANFGVISEISGNQVV
jgi:hypothetical protein